MPKNKRDSEYEYTGDAPKRGGFEYQYDFDLCERIGRRVGVLLARANFDGAFRSLAYAIEKELHVYETTVADLAIIELPWKDDGDEQLQNKAQRLANAIETGLGHVFLNDLRGVAESDFSDLPVFGTKTMRQLREAIESVGVPFPIPADYVFSKRCYRPPSPIDPSKYPPTPQASLPIQEQVTMANRLIDILCDASESDLDDIDKEVAALEAKIEKLRKARKLLTGMAVKDGGKKPAERVIAYLREHGPQTRDALSKALYIKPQGITATLKSERLAEADGLVHLTEGND